MLINRFRNYLHVNQPFYSATEPFTRRRNRFTRRTEPFTRRRNRFTRRRNRFTRRNRLTPGKSAIQPFLLGERNRTLPFFNYRAKPFHHRRNCFNSAKPFPTTETKKDTHDKRSPRETAKSQRQKTQTPHARTRQTPTNTHTQGKDCSGAARTVRNSYPMYTW
jgi:hypothetical protein